MQPFDFQNSKDSTKINQKYHLVPQEVLKQQAHLFFMQEFDMQNSKDSTKNTQKSYLPMFNVNKSPPKISRAHDFEQKNWFPRFYQWISRPQNGKNCSVSLPEFAYFHKNIHKTCVNPMPSTKKCQNFDNFTQNTHKTF